MIPQGAEHKSAMSDIPLNYELRSLWALTNYKRRSIFHSYAVSDENRNDSYNA